MATFVPPAPPAAPQSVWMDHPVSEDLVERIRTELARSPPSTYEHHLPLSDEAIAQRQLFLSTTQVAQPSGRDHAQRMRAYRIRVELSRDPPSTYSGQNRLSDAEIAERRARLVAYDAARTRQQSSKHARAMRAIESQRAPPVHKLHKLARSVRARPVAEPAAARAAEPAGPDDLYIMQNSRIPGEFKIGRSRDVRARQRDLQASQNYRMIVHAVYPEAGHLERRVHDILADCRVQGAPGTEWFKTTLSAAGAAVMLAKESGNE